MYDLILGAPRSFSTCMAANAMRESAIRGTSTWWTKFLRSGVKWDHQNGGFESGGLVMGRKKTAGSRDATCPRT